MLLPNRDNLTELRFLNDKENGGALYFLPFCQSQVDKHPQLNTKEWLVTKKILKEKATIQALLRSENFDPQFVVVKVGEREPIESEYYRSRLLYTSGLKGFVPYICMFHCSDDKNVYVKKTGDVLNDGFCGKETRSSMYAIVMPYLTNGSLEELIKNDLIEFEQVKAVVCKTIENLRAACNAIGFIHRDTSFNNIFPAVDADGYIDSILIDYGNSFVIPRGILTTRTRNELIGYSIMVYRDFATILDEMAAVYMKKDFYIPQLRRIQQWLEDHFAGNRLDVDLLLEKIWSFSIVPIPTRKMGEKSYDDFPLV